MHSSFTDSVKGLGSFRDTSDGYLVGEVLCARTGVQTYNRRELGLQGDGTINVYRPPEAVFNRSSLSTFGGKPVTMGHPKEAVSSENWRDLAVGQVGEEVVRDGESVRVQIALMDAAAIQAVKGGTREISMGYQTPLELKDGTAPDGTPYQAVQTGPIRINHLAIVDRARGGSELRINLGDEDWVSPIDDAYKPSQPQKGLQSREGKPQTANDNEPEDTQNMNRIVIDGFTIEVNDQAREAIVKLQKQLADAQKDLDEKDTELAEKDVELEKTKEERDKAKKAVPTGDALDLLVAERTKVTDAARSVVGDMKFDGLSNEGIKKAVVRKTLGDSVVDGKLEGKSEIYADAFYDAHFDSLVSDRKTETPRGSSLADGISHMKSKHFGDAVAKEEDDAFQATVNRFNRKKKAEA